MQNTRRFTIIPESPRGAFWMGFSIAAVLGLSVILIIGPLMGVSGAFGGVGHDGYWEIACNLARGNGFVFEPGGPPELHRPPLIPLLFAPLTLLPSWLCRPGVIVLQSLFFGATCFLVYDLAWRIGGVRIARLAAGMLLLYPWAYWHVKNPMNVVAQMFGIMLVMDLIASNFWRRERPILAAGPFAHPLGRSICTGLAMGLLSLVHGTTFPAMVLILLLMLIAGIVCRNRRLVVAAGISGLVAAVVISPWTYRNWTVAHRFLPVVHSAPYAYFLGNNHWGFGVDRAFASRTNEFQQAFAAANMPDLTATVRYSGVTDVAVANELETRMVQDMKAHPAQLLVKILLDGVEYYCPLIYNFFGPRFVSEGVSWIIETVVISAFHFALWVLALIGLWKIRDRKLRFALFLIFFCIIMLCAPYLPAVAGTIEHAQYAAPLIPLLMILAAAGVSALIDARNATHPMATAP
jgi:4-amino-4-deoxy-L-arabinose transferase-like glycosyltransferase